MSAPKTSYHHGELRDALVHAAVELLEDQGVASLSLREIARRAGVSHAAPYHHFPDKEALLDAVATEGMTRMQQAMEAAATAATSALEGLQSFGLAYCRFASEHPALFRVMYSRQKSPRPGAEALQKTGAGMFESISQAIQAATGQDPAKAADTALVLWASVHGLAMLWLDGQFTWGEGATIDGLAWRLTEALGGVLPPRPTTSG